MSDDVLTTLREMTGAVAQRVYYGRTPGEGYRRRVTFGDDGSLIAREALEGPAPCLIARFGSSELGCASFYLRWRRGRILPVPYPSSLRQVMRDNAGFFPATDSNLDKYAEAFLEAVSETDVMGVWFLPGEERVVEQFCPEASLVFLEALNVVCCEHPWSAALAGKTVLVVHPFARTIESQYRENRSRLFANPETLPEFELKTLAAVQSAAGNPCAYADWFEALNAMNREIASIEFDVAVIGAGSYGLPLAAAVKRSGRKAVHLGGQTQLLFGIRGRRWETEYDDAHLFNEYWVRPSAAETPAGAERVEGGCYW